MNTKEDVLTDRFLMLAMYSFLLEERWKNQQIWNDFEDEVISKNRFFVSHEVLDEIEKQKLNNTLFYPKEQVFYRARIFDGDPNLKFLEKYKEVLKENGEDFDNMKSKYKGSEILDYNIALIDSLPNDNSSSFKYEKEAIRRCKNSRFKGYNKDDSIAPPAEKCLAGRANPKGIRYLYVCEDESTPIYEVKPAIKQNISVAKLKLKRDIKIFDLSTNYQNNQAIIQGLFSFISEKFAIPNYNDVLKYIPTQCVTEKIKKLGFDGIRFNSSLNAGGKNLVLFNVDDCEVISTSIVNVDEIKITTRAAGIYGKNEESNKLNDFKI